MRISYILLLIIIVGLIVWFIIIRNPAQEINEQETIANNLKVSMEQLTLTSSAFAHNARIPEKYTCDGDSITGGISPALQISGVDANTKSLTLIMDDPDAPAGTWDHWIIFNISPSVALIEEGEEPQGIAGNNSWGRVGYSGPCPPDREHRYFFKLFALDTDLDLKESVTKDDVLRAMKGHIIQQTELVGLYERN